MRGCKTSLDLYKQIADRNPKGARDSDQVQRRTIANASLDPAHVAPTDPRNVGKRLLREALTFPDLTNPLPQTPEGRMLRRLPSLWWHG
jgi:hypothetical protein